MRSVMGFRVGRGGREADRVELMERRGDDKGNWVRLGFPKDLKKAEMAMNGSEDR
jgi:hypothetical protein